MADFELNIKSFEVHDQEAARKLILDGLGEHFGYIDETLNPDIDDILAHYVTSGHIFLVVQAANDIVGTGALIIKNASVGKIVRVSVHKKYRRRGIGKAVLEHLLEMARQRELSRLIVETNKDWYDAIALYKRLGFVEYEQNATVVHMALNLS